MGVRGDQDVSVASRGWPCHGCGKRAERSRSACRICCGPGGGGGACRRTRARCCGLRDQGRAGAAAPTRGRERRQTPSASWQREQPLDAIRELVLEDQRLRNEICWSVRPLTGGTACLHRTSCITFPLSNRCKPLSGEWSMPRNQNTDPAPEDLRIDPVLFVVICQGPAVDFALFCWLVALKPFLMFTGQAEEAMRFLCLDLSRRRNPPPRPLRTRRLQAE